MLEALVALVLLSSVGFTLLAWVQQNLDALQHMQDVYNDLEARRTVVKWSRALNPMAQASGEARVGELRIAWQATQQGNVVSQSGYPSGIGLYDLAMYDVSIIVFRGDASIPLMTENIVRVGYRRARDSVPSFLRR